MDKLHPSWWQFHARLGTSEWALLVDPGHHHQCMCPLCPCQSWWWASLAHDMTNFWFSQTQLHCSEWHWHCLPSFSVWEADDWTCAQSLGSSHNGRKNWSRCIITCKASLAHATPIVHYECLIVAQLATDWDSSAQSKTYPKWYTANETKETRSHPRSRKQTHNNRQGSWDVMTSCATLIGHAWGSDSSSPTMKTEPKMLQQLYTRFVDSIHQPPCIICCYHPDPNSKSINLHTTRLAMGLCLI